MAFGSSFMGKSSKTKKELSNRSYYKSMIDNKLVSAFLADMDGDILLVNSKAGEFTGYSEEEFIGRKLREIFVTLTGDDNPLDSDNIREFEKELYLIKSSSYLIPVLLELSEIEGGKFLCTIKPVSASPKQQLSDIRTSSVRVVSDSSAVEASPSDQITKLDLSEEEDHAIRNSLNIILGFSSILIKEPSVVSNRKLLGYIKPIISNGNVLKNILDISDNLCSDNSDTSLKKCLLSPIIQKSQILLQAKADQNSIELVIEMPGEFAVMSDEIVLFEIVNYLIEKAIVFCRSMFIDIKVRPGQVDGELLLIIDNLGQDIPTAVKNFIKSENNSSSYDYSNEILSSNPDISTLLKNLNGINAKIKFESSDDLGDIAMLELPIYNDSGKNDSNLDSDASSNEIRKKALIIEDDKLNAIILKNHLQQFTDTSTAFSGNEALNIIEMLHDKGDAFDIVFTDIGLPAPWDGITLKEEIIKRWPEYDNIPFVAQTGYSAKSFSEKIRKSGFTGYLVKPINRNDIKKFVNSI